MSISSLAVTPVKDSVSPQGWRAYAGKVSGGFSVRTILRTILAFALLFGSGAADWAPVLAQAGVLNHESCCCGTPASSEDSCPCPKPEGNRSPSTALCALRTMAVASLDRKSTRL